MSRQDKIKQLSVLVSLKTSKLLKRTLTLQENAFIAEVLNTDKKYIIKTVNPSDQNPNAGFLALSKLAMQYADYITESINALEKDFDSDAIATKAKKAKQTELYPNDVDIHTYMTTEVRNNSSIPEYNASNDTSTALINPVNLGNFLGMNNRKDLQNTFNPKSRYIKNYLILDSRYRNLDTNGTTNYQWTYDDTNNLSTFNGVNTSGTIRNLVAIKLYQFVFPTSATLNNDSGRLSIFIQEFKGAAFVANGSQNYHWMARVAQGTALPQPSAFYAQCQVEDYQDGIIYFNKPIVNIDKFTLSFGDPLNTVSLPYDRSRAIIQSYGATTLIRTDITNNLSIGGRVFISLFTTDAPVTDAVAIAQMNNPMGMLVTNIVSPTDFVVAVDTSTVTPKAGLFIMVYFAQFRFILSFEMTYLRD